MAFDAETTERTVTRDRVMRFRDVLAKVPPEQFDMMLPAPSKCGSAACICGWARTVFFDGRYEDSGVVAEYLGLSPKDAANLFWMTNRSVGPDLDAARHYGSKTPAQAVAVLDHYLDTGEIDWSVAK